MIIEFIVLAAIAVFLAYKWASASHDYWEKRHIPYDKPFPLLGSFKGTILRTQSMFECVLDVYNKYDYKAFGVFDQRMPVLMIRDRELLKHITVKDFDHFVNHRTIFDDSDGDLFGNSLFSMRNAKWKDMRSTLSPAFTGSKMRQMFQFMNEVAKDSLMLLKEQAIKSNGQELDIKNFFTLFTNDTIASTAFGLQVNSFRDPSNEFYVVGKRVTQFTAWQNFKFLIFANFKLIAKTFKISLFNHADTDYFMRLVLGAMKDRQMNNIVRPDMINMLLEAKGLTKSENSKTSNRDWSDVEMVAQCFLFFFAGFETAAVLMSFAAHELMENPEIQTRLRTEIDEVTEELNGKDITYEALQGMKYMDMVICETLRKWPPAVLVDRQCNADFLFKDEDFEIKIKSGDNIFIPIAGYHHDPKYFKNPSKFDPERFSEENKDNILPFTYMPFGMGPRNCIASRFVQLEAKAILFYLVKNFYLEISEKTVIPIQLIANGFQLGSKDGFWMKLMPRQLGVKVNGNGTIKND